VEQIVIGVRSKPVAGETAGVFELGCPQLVSRDHGANPSVQRFRQLGRLGLTTTCTSLAARAIIPAGFRACAAGSEEKVLAIVPDEIDAALLNKTVKKSDTSPTATESLTY
jgi:hypothetical protein